MALAGLVALAAQPARASTDSGLVLSPGIKLAYTFGHGLNGLTVGVEVSLLYYDMAAGAFGGGVVGADLILAEHPTLRLSVQAEGGVAFGGLATGLSILRYDGAWLFGFEVSPFAGFAIPLVNARHYTDVWLSFIPYYHFSYYPDASYGHRSIHEIGMFVKAPVSLAPGVLYFSTD